MENQFKYRINRTKKISLQINVVESKEIRIHKINQSRVKIGGVLLEKENKFQNLAGLYQWNRRTHRKSVSKKKGVFEYLNKI